ncbi:methyl-accepting chemotaxis protein [Bacillus sp. FJAT-42376]|uniref:methyl-accepting chemotaxis protein n=1 Tax=Bacillus sp. FJAT-42376 TaxID=2014076 RepID=UPI000F4F104A|nr:methyl-accepting chemotaxis protein [Bacillus sp. FJAT-42376]AZB42500.1 methyl-accepting chemotaxis protein [Bacillus sp. FJAT-42376]
MKKTQKNVKSVRKILVTGFGFLIGLSVLLAVLNFASIYKTKMDTERIVNVETASLILSEKLSYNLAQQASTIRAYFLYDSPSYKDEYEKLKKEGESLQKDLLAASDNPEIRSLIKKTADWHKLLEDDVISRYEGGFKIQAVQNLSKEPQTISNELIKDYMSMANEREKQIMNSGIQIIRGGEVTSIVILVFSFLIAGAGLFIAFRTSKIIARPISQLTKKMNEIASGVLKRDTLPSNNKNELGTLIDSANAMNLTLLTLVGEIKSAAGEIEHQSGKLQTSSIQVKEGSEQIASTMQELTLGAESQAESAADMAENMGHFLDKMGESAAGGELAAKSAGEVLRETKNGRSLMTQSIEDMNRIYEVMKTSVSKVAGLDEQSRKISKLMEVIQSVADQTNLLSLNAAIEAARAGEHGKGFAVVADEVRKLAEQVSHSVDDIDAIVNSVRSETGAVALDLKTGYEQVLKGKTSIEKTGHSFEIIHEKVEEVSSGITLISSRLDDLLERGRNMDDAISNIASVSEEAAAGIEQTAAAAEQANGTMEMVRENSIHLSGLSEKLALSVNQFKH